MKLVKQEDEMGCGIACIAGLLNSSYSDAIKLVNSKLAKTRGYYCREIVKALGKKKLKYEYKKVLPKTKKLIYNPGSIVFIKRSKKFPEGHYVLKTSKGWMNPWINLPIVPRKAGYNKRLPGTAQWVIFNKES